MVVRKTCGKHIYEVTATWTEDEDGRKLSATRTSKTPTYGETTFDIVGLTVADANALLRSTAFCQYPLHYLLRDALNEEIR